MESKKRSHEQVEANNHGEPPPKRPSTTMSKEPSIFNLKVVDDVTRYIADFIAQYCNRENVEIEAKLGVFIDKRTNQRINVNALTETIISSEQQRQYRFESNMSLEQHRHFNKILNDMVNKTQAPEYKGERIKYKHTIETDRFYEIPNTRQKWRVTIDSATGKIVPNGIIEKTRLADLNIHSPNQPLDYRISINIESPRPKPTGDFSFERNKDRVSYQHGGIAFDLTQVKSSPNREDWRHEFELEIADTKLLAKERARQERKEASQYMQTIEVFMNNIRILSRSALKQ